MFFELALIFIDIEICHKTKNRPQLHHAADDFKGKPPIQTQGYRDKIPTNSHPHDCLYLSGLDYTILLERPHQTRLFRDKKQTKESHLGGSPLFDMVRVTGLESQKALFPTCCILRDLA